jgi:hypothetical protein
MFPDYLNLPLAVDRRELWRTLVVDLEAIIDTYFRTSFVSLEYVQLRPVCRIRRIFVLQQSRSEICLPEAFDFSSTLKKVIFSPVFIPELRSVYANVGEDLSPENNNEKNKISFVVPQNSADCFAMDEGETCPTTSTEEDIRILLSRRLAFVKSCLQIAKQEFLGEYKTSY